MNDSETSPDSAESRARMPRLYWLGMLTLALFVRRGMIISQATAFQQDIDGYRELGKNLARLGVYAQYDGYRMTPEAFRPPLYPWLLACCDWFVRDSTAPIAVLHVVMGAATVVAVLGTAWNLGLGRRSLLAALVVLVDPILLHHSTLVMTETLATFLASVVLWIVTRPDWRESRLGWVLAGGCMGLAALARPTFLVWIVLSTMWLLLASDFHQRRWLRAIAFFCSAAVVIVPWPIRNWNSLGSPIVTTTHGGYTLHLANNPGFYAHLRNDPWGTVWDGRVDVVMRNGLAAAHDYRTNGWRFRRRSIEADYWNYRQAWKAICDEPGMFAWSCVMRWGYLFQLAPHQLDPQETSTHRAARYAIGVWYAGLYVLALRGAWMIGRGWLRWPWAWNLLLVISFLLPHTVYWTNMRMRAPLTPVLALVAAVGVVRKRNPTSTEPASNAA